MRRSFDLLARNQSGMALVIALILMVVLTLIGLASTLSSTFEIRLSGNKRGSTGAFYSADSGVQVVMANVKNFDLPGKYVNDKYPDPLTDGNNPNPTYASVSIQHLSNQFGAPRGLGLSAAGNYDFVHFRIDSTGQDQIELNPLRSTCMIEQNAVRLVPTLQGGN